jgi:hypothetical protein
MDMAVLVEANVRLKASNEELSRVLIRLTKWLIGLTIFVAILTLPLSIEVVVRVFRHLMG